MLYKYVTMLNCPNSSLSGKGQKPHLTEVGTKLIDIY
jgi:hypothetical protein